MNNLLAGILPQAGGLEASGSGKYTAAMGILALLSVAGSGGGRAFPVRRA